MRTLRTDRWWLAPALTFAGLMSFLIYGFWAIFDKSYFVDPYIAPFSSPCLATSCPPGARFLGLAPFGDWYGLPPGLLILGLPGGFRLTCYYYRKSYYRSFWLSPPACAVAEPHGKYTGESRLPLILQNIHRYFFYGALVIGAILTYDAILALVHKPGGLGTWILIANAVLIMTYTLSCHSCRHITAGRLNHFSRHPLRYRAWTFVSKLNAKHQPLAWASMFSVMIADLYVRLVAKGVITFPFA
ncbi:membrane protein [Microbispora sp. ATCC PTA-5024]|nr:membrane protein [Microbispora sp. ATCC PTA-5024]